MTAPIRTLDYADQAPEATRQQTAALAVDEAVIVRYYVDYQRDELADKLVIIDSTAAPLPQDEEHALIVRDPYDPDHELLTVPFSHLHSILPNPTPDPSGYCI